MERAQEITEEEIFSVAIMALQNDGAFNVLSKVFKDSVMQLYRSLLVYQAIGTIAREPRLIAASDQFLACLVEGINRYAEETRKVAQIKSPGPQTKKRKKNPE